MIINNIIDFDSKKPHLLITSVNGDKHVIPVEVFKNIASGKLSITDIDDYNELIPTIINEWLFLAHGD